MFRITFDESTNNLFVSELDGDVFYLNALIRNPNKWDRVQRQTAFQTCKPYWYHFDLTVCDGRNGHTHVLLGWRNRAATSVTAFVVPPDHKLISAGTMNIPQIPQGAVHSIACTNTNDRTYVAMAQGANVTLYELVATSSNEGDRRQLKRLDSVQLTRPRNLMFRSNLLLVSDIKHTNEDNIEALEFTSRKLLQRQQILKDTGVQVLWWSIARHEDMLVIATNDDIRVYSFQEK